jgi:hypothetical protein
MLLSTSGDNSARWNASFIAFSGDTLREVSVEILTLVEKQGAAIPLMSGIASWECGYFIRGTSRRLERTSFGRLRFTILPHIVPWRRALAKTFGWQSCPLGR